MAKKEDPQMVLIKHSVPVIVVQSHCSCVAGSALCNHLVALLYQTVHYSQLNIPVAPPVDTCLIWTFPASQKRMPTFLHFTAPLLTYPLSPDVPLVESTFGPVQCGSVLSYQLPQPKTCEIVKIADAPFPPILPLDGYRLQASQCAYVLSHQEQFHLNALETTYKISHKVKVEHQLRKMRITSSLFRKVCHVLGETSADHLAERMFKGSGIQTMEMKRRLAMEPVAVQEYCTLKIVNFFPCGFVVHQDAPWLGSSPDGIIFDSSVRPHV
ncbi:uncharacterized protein LOC110527645 [Oncorhynchus mykiss]|uniref:uncharacterized protein LOC110527645 n=1 Tax=Oncorhynchus mykiss TaxID=8022 RepID=UPI0018782F8C|nr:uncharacterized protein LOC110527645 [Oncorhynchus mykiss]